MGYIIIISFVILSIGIYFFLSSLTLSKLQFYKNYKSNYKKLTLVESIANKIIIPEKFESIIQEKLNSLYIETPVNLYIVNVILQGVIFISVVLITLYFSTILGILISVYIMIYIKYKYDKQYSKVNEIKNSIEEELPKFTLMIAENIKYDKNIINLFQSYAVNTNENFANELYTTIAEMRVYSTQVALYRLSSRVNSASLSKVVNHLVNAINGNDSIESFYNLARELKIEQINEVKKKVAKQPEILNKYSWTIAFSFIFTMLYVLLVIIGQTMQEMF